MVWDQELKKLPFEEQSPKQMFQTVPSVLASHAQLSA